MAANVRGLARVGLVALLAAGVGAARAEAGGADWPQWRGPRRDGIAVGVTLPEPWPQAPRKAWSLEVGLGHASPVVADGKVVVLARQGDEEVVRCVAAADGRPLWRDAYAAPYKPRLVARKHGKGPFATPTIAGGRVYTFGVTGVLNCCHLATGKRLWRTTYADPSKRTYPTWGAASSPLVEGTLCILAAGGTRRGGIAAFHKDSGALVWKLAADGPGYGSAVAANLAGQRQIITLTSTKVLSATVPEGKLLWDVPYKTAWEQNIVTPVLHDGRVIFSGYRMGTTAFAFAVKGGNVTGEQLWINDDVSMYMSSPVVVGGHLYALAQRGRGTLVCLSLEDGKTVWRGPGRLGDYASLVGVGDKLLALTTRGELLVVAAGPTARKELARTRLTEREVWAHLAVTADRLFVKDKTHLACFALRGE